MTEMKRVTIALPENIDKQILELRKNDCFVRCSYSEIVRRVMEHGLKLLQSEAAAAGGPARAEPERESA